MDLLGIALLFYLPYALVMFEVGRKVRTDEKLVRAKHNMQVAYSACRVAFERGGSHEDQNQEALNIIKSKINVSDEEAQNLIDDVLGGVPGAGKSGKEKFSQ